METESLEPLRQRIIASCHLGPMSFDETWQYVEHRLNIVGWANDPMFTLDAYQRIHECTSGIPRRVNTLCDRILLVGYLEEAHEVTEQLVDRVVQELTEESVSGWRANDETGGPKTVRAQANDSVSKPEGDSAPSHAFLERKILRIEERLEALEMAIATSSDDATSDIRALEQRLEEQQRASEQLRRKLDDEVENLLFWLKPLHERDASR